MNKGKTPQLSDSPGTSEAHKMIEIVVRHHFAAVWLSFGEAPEMEAWLAYLRGLEQKAGRKDKMKLLIGVGNLSEATNALQRFKPDLLAVTGGEAGGHGLAGSPPLMQLLPQVVQLVSKAPTKPLIFGAGGLSDGASLASILALGGDGGIFGTRYLLTPQSAYTQQQKQILLENKGDTLRTMAFDEARGTTGWPEGVDGRGIYNDTVKDYQAGLGDENSRRETYSNAAKASDTKRIVTWSGTGVGNMNEILDAGELTVKLTQQARDAIQRLQESLR